MFEQLEVVLVGLDLGSLEDLEAVGVEDLAQVAHHRLDRVQVAGRHRPSGRGHVDRLVRQACVEVGQSQRIQALPDRRLELAPNLVRALADGRALVSGQRSQLPEHGGELPRSPEQLVAQLIDGRGIGGGREGLPGLGADPIELV